MTFSQLLEKVEEAAFNRSAELAAELAFDFAEENELAPVEQDALEEAVEKGAKRAGHNPENELHFFKTELELLAGGAVKVSRRGPEFF